MVSLLDENEVRVEMGEAFASFMLNPTVTWAKFVLTDDRTNGNGERIPREEFANLIKSGIHMPVKMVVGEIQGHPESKPLGTITHLKRVDTEDGSSAIVALAALWGQERPADVEYIKKRFAEKKPVDVSWEVLYGDSVLNTEVGSIDLLETVLKAATIVGNPAYQGRTPFLAVSSKKAENAELENTNENNSEDTLMEPKELEVKLGEAQSQLAALEAKVAEMDAEITRLTEENKTKETELAELREFKSAAEAEVAKAEKLEAIKAKFTEAGIEKDENYFVENADRLLNMDERVLEFFVQEMAANLTTEASKKASSASSKTTKIPALTGNEDEEDTSPAGLAKYLRERKSK